MHHDRSSSGFLHQDYNRNEIKNQLPSKSIQIQKNNDCDYKFFQNLTCCQNVSKDKKRFSNENAINEAQKEVDFKTFFRNVIEKGKCQNQIQDEGVVQNNALDNRSHRSSLKINEDVQKSSLNKIIPFESQIEERQKKSLLNLEENQKRESKYKYNIFNMNQKPLEEYSDNKNVRQYLNDLDNLLSTYNRNSLSKKQFSGSFSPQTKKKSRTFSIHEDKSSNGNNENESHRRSMNRLSRKYMRSSSKSPENKLDLSLGEFLCINCDEFIDNEDMNTHYKICEKMPENKDLIIINYKLEKIKTALLLNMKKETGFTDTHLEECLDILLNCLQKIICSNENIDVLDEIMDDLNEILRELPLCVTPKNRVYITLLDRIRELANLKKNVAEENRRINKENDEIDKSKNLRCFYPDRKIFAPPSSHFAYVEQKENDWNRYSDYSGSDNAYKAQNKKKERVIFRELNNFRKNEEFLLAKPKEISLSPPNIAEKKDDIKIEIKETENFRKIKNFLMEKEKQRAKFNEKMSKISIPELQQLSGSSGSVMFRGDFNRKKKFLELVEKLQQKNNPARKNIVSNTELYEECQNNQIHENNWEGFVRQKFQNIY